MTTKLKNKIIGFKEFRQNANRYIGRVNRCEYLTIVRRSEPIFRMFPPDEDDNNLWETVIDFTKINKNGVPAEKVLKALKKLNAED